MNVAALDKKHDFILMENGIDDDALLSGLPSWNDKIRLPVPNETLSGTPSSQDLKPGESASRPKVVPSVTTVTAEDDKRMALRMAALKSLAARSLLKRSQKSRKLDSNSMVSPLCETHSETKQLPTRSEQVRTDLPDNFQKDGIMTKAVADSISLKPIASPGAPKRPDYTDVDAPDQDSNELNYTQNDTEEVLKDTRNTRQRVSYADEFSVRPEAPLGDVGSSSWLDRLHSSSSPARLREQKRALPSSQPSSTRLSSVSNAHVLPRGRTPPKRFFKEKPWRPLVIEWSDDEEDEAMSLNSDLKPVDIKIKEELDVLRDLVCNTQMELPAQQVFKKDKKTSATLTRKESEIQAMMAKIQALENKRLQLQANKDHSDSKTLLGKRSAEENLHDMQVTSADDCESSRTSNKVC